MHAITTLEAVLHPPEDVIIGRVCCFVRSLVRSLVNSLVAISRKDTSIDTRYLF